MGFSLELRRQSAALARLHPRLFLLRHCETEWNRSGNYQGRSDVPLSASGADQAERLADALAPRLGRLAAIVSSPLRRALMTATPLAARLQLPVATDDRLIELSYGLWEGHTQEEVKVLWPDLLRQWKTQPDAVSFPSGESLHDLKSRVRSFLEEAAGREGPVLAVTHDGVVRIATLEALGLPLSEFRAFRTKNASLVAFAFHDGGLSLVDDAIMASNDAARSA